VSIVVQASHYASLLHTQSRDCECVVGNIYRARPGVLACKKRGMALDVD
jgi:hypothetical protein